MLYQAQSPVGAGLLAIRAPRSNRYVQVWPSRASPLPPIKGRPLNPLPSPTPCGSGLARDGQTWTYLCKGAVNTPSELQI